MIKQTKAIDGLRELPDDSVDLIFGSPPYEDARLNDGEGTVLKGEDWVRWMVEVCEESRRVCKGLVAYVVEGRTRKFDYSGTPFLLFADLKRAGFKMRKIPIYKRNGIPGSGGPDWLRNDYEPIICFAKGKLPWSKNTACGKPPKYKRGGGASHRKRNGERVASPKYANVKIANPGNVVDCGAVGGGNIGSHLAHQNEAPFSIKLPMFFIKSFCPPDGTVLDPFSGSGTTLAVAKRLGRNWIGFDVRESQVDLTKRRLGIDG